jgi:TetR/AcrR family tetracycline transcriptional repressor
VVRTPGQRAGLTQDQVLTAALELLRREGLDQVSMRRVAAELGVAPNALYSHLPDKSALLDGLLDAVLADVAIPAAGDWRARVGGVLAESRRVLLAHPDLVRHFLARQTSGPNAARLGEAVLEALHDGGVRGARAARALQVLLVHTIGGAAFEVPRRREPDPGARAARSRAAAAALDPGAFPRTTELAAELARHPGDALFDAGLRWILDGLAADVQAPSTS